MIFIAKEVIEVWTDGSSKAMNTERPYGGWGCLLKLGDKVAEFYGGEDLTTNNRMEMTAVIKALLSINIDGNRDVKVYSDSAYIVNCINDKWYVKWRDNNWTNSQKKEVENKDLWIKMLERIDEFNQKGLNVELLKVKGHSGDEGNDRADELANMGSALIKKERDKEGVLYTSYFSSGKSIGTKIGIVRIKPEWLDFKKESIIHMDELSPSYELLMRYNDKKEDNLESAWEDYVIDFKEEMTTREGMAKMLKGLESGLKKGNDITLLCYEKDSNYCHRSLIREHFRQLGYKTGEL